MATACTTFHGPNHQASLDAAASLASGRRASSGSSTDGSVRSNSGPGLASEAQKCGSVADTVGVTGAIAEVPVAAASALGSLGPMQGPGVDWRLAAAEGLLDAAREGGNDGSATQEMSQVGGALQGSSGIALPTMGPGHGRATELELEMDCIEATSAAGGVHLRPSLPISPRARSIIEALLQVNPSARLGGGSVGGSAVKAHPFFDGWGQHEWQALLERKMPPPVAVAINSPFTSWTPSASPMMPPLEMRGIGEQARGNASFRVDGELSCGEGSRTSAPSLPQSAARTGERVTDMTDTSDFLASDYEEDRGNHGDHLTHKQTAQAPLPPEALQRCARTGAHPSLAKSTPCQHLRASEYLCIVMAGGLGISELCRGHMALAIW